MCRDEDGAVLVVTAVQPVVGPEFPQVGGGQDRAKPA